MKARQGEGPFPLQASTQPRATADQTQPSCSPDRKWKWNPGRVREKPTNSGLQKPISVPLVSPISNSAWSSATRRSGLGTNRMGK